MSIAPMAADEAERLQRLVSLQILDSQPDPRFDRLAARALELFPEALAGGISLIDRDRVWFKATKGLNLEEVPRDIAFCSHAILTSAVTVVPDLLQDHRFANNVLVVGDPKFRFYAGAPLSSGLGVVWVLGIQPIASSPEQLDQLVKLALLADTQILMHGALAALQRPAKPTAGRP